CNDWIYAKPSEPIHCRINAALGREREFEIKPAEKKKRVLVVGAGTAGLEAARVAAIRGHEVSVYDKQHRLGGLVPMAQLIKGARKLKEDPSQIIENLQGVLRYFEHQNNKLGVRTVLGKEITPALVEEIKPDVVLIASGGVITVPEIPGIDRRIVVNPVYLHRMLKRFLRFFGPNVLRWLTSLWMPVGKRVVIIGGAMQGIELAEFLIRRGRKVTIVESSEELGYEMQMDDKVHTLAWLEDKCTMMTGVRYEEITDKGLVITTREGKIELIEADSVVPATLLGPDTELLKALEGTAKEVYPIGDSREPHLIRTAIADGSKIARLI
ncbi:NAD(P)/FAD-dependent oxidoreductase, partial [Chloroflexota bacterium]